MSGGAKGFDSIIKVFNGKHLSFSQVFKMFEDNLGNKPHVSLSIIRHGRTALYLDRT